MNQCKGRSVSDVSNKYKIAFSNSNNLPTKYYHIPIYCDNKSLLNGNLCGKCLEKERKLKSCSIVNNSLKCSSGRIVSHPSVLHGLCDDPIPSWSHLENGEWFKSMLQKGYQRMPSKKEVIHDESLESKIKEEVTKLTGKNNDKITQLMKLFPSLTKTAALNYIIKKKKPVTKNENVIESLQEKLYINPDKKDEIYEIVKIIIKPLIISNKKYYYDHVKDKLYDTELKYLGRYKDGTIYTEFPDSDEEPNLA